MSDPFSSEDFPALDRPVLAGAARFRERSRLVRQARRWTPIAMGAIVLLIAGWIGVSSLLANVAAERARSGSIHMTNPKFYGRDQKGRAFRLEAATAVRDNTTPDYVALQTPALALESGGTAKPMIARSPTGAYREAEGFLALTGGVVVDDGKGGRYLSQTADVDVHKGEVHGRDKVSGQSPLGSLTASSYSIDQNGDHSVFSGGVHAHLTNQ